MLEQELLKLNEKSGYYETKPFVVKIEAEIYQRMFFKYIEEHHVDLSDINAVELAAQEMLKVGKWLSHPRTEVAAYVPDVHITQPLVKEEYSGPRYTRIDTLNTEEEKELWKQARLLPEDQWDLLKPPLIDGMSKEDKEKNGIYHRRSAITKSLDKLREKMKIEREYPVIERVEAISEAVNNNRLK